MIGPACEEGGPDGALVLLHHAVVLLHAILGHRVLLHHALVLRHGVLLHAVLGHRVLLHAVVLAHLVLGKGGRRQSEAEREYGCGDCGRDGGASGHVRFILRKAGFGRLMPPYLSTETRPPLLRPAIEKFTEGRIFAIFAGVFLRKRDTISPAREKLVRPHATCGIAANVRRNKVAGTYYRTREKSGIHRLYPPRPAQNPSQIVHGKSSCSHAVISSPPRSLPPPFSVSGPERQALRPR